MKLTIDANIAVKWYCLEENSEEANRLLDPQFVLHAPDFILVEVANVMWKKFHLGEIRVAEPYVEELAQLPDAVELHTSVELIKRATELSVQHNHPVYDCIYIALAEGEMAPLVTADRRLCLLAGQVLPSTDVWDIGHANFVERIR